jgi:hypothetical protein
MRAACMLFLAGCGFRSPAATSLDDAAPDGTAANGPICASIAAGTPQFTGSACAMPSPQPLHVTATTSIDTDLGTSSPSGASCARTTNGNLSLCILAAPSIVIDPGVVLAAHGSIPLALFAHAITIRGTVDVASHAGSAASGAGARRSGCIAGSFPSLAGGGHGGAASGQGGAGGAQGGAPSSGGQGSFSFGIVAVIGGCGGTRGGDGTIPTVDDGGATTGGAGGGAIWIASDSADLVLDAGASINASGAGGAGGTTAAHGGAGGGAGGIIVLQAPAIHLDPAAAIFANGGAGGGGAGANPTGPGFTGGTDGTDPTGPSSGGIGGAGGIDGAVLGPAGATGAVLGPTVAGLGPTGASLGPADAVLSGDGSPGFPADPRNGHDGVPDGHGGGGGGGGAGAIRVVSPTILAGGNVSPPPLNLQ